MKQLCKEERITHTNLVQRLREAEGSVERVIDKFNMVLQDETRKVEQIIDEYNSLVNEAREFVSMIHEEQDAFSQEKSDAWRASERGIQYEDWMSQWGNITLDDAEIVFPEEIEWPQFVADYLEDLVYSPEEL